MGGVETRSVRGLLTAGAVLGAATTMVLIGSALLGTPAVRDRLDRIGPGRGGERAPKTSPWRPGELGLPVEGIDPSRLTGSFEDPRSRGRIHHAIDIPAPRRARVVAVDDGRIERLAHSRLGGISLYQRDARGRYCFYYAHLDGWAEGLSDGVPVRRGQLLGFVGTTGNAEGGAPHLHFAVHEVGTATCAGAPVDPLPLLRAD